MRPMSLIVLLGAILVPETATSLTCPDPRCPGRQCVHQCLGSACGDYCVRLVPTRTVGAAGTGTLTLRIPEATPAFAARLRRFIETQ